MFLSSRQKTLCGSLISCSICMTLFIALNGENVPKCMRVTHQADGTKLQICCSRSGLKGVLYRSCKSIHLLYHSTIEPSITAAWASIVLITSLTLNVSRFYRRQCAWKRSYSIHAIPFVKAKSWGHTVAEAEMHLPNVHLQNNTSWTAVPSGLLRSSLISKSDNVRDVIQAHTTSRDEFHENKEPVSLKPLILNTWGHLLRLQWLVVMNRI